MPQIPPSFVLIGQVSLVPLVGIVAAVVASRLPVRNADS
jgi:hypothetical protein